MFWVIQLRVRSRSWLEHCAKWIQVNHHLGALFLFRASCVKSNFLIWMIFFTKKEQEWSFCFSCQEWLVFFSFFLDESVILRLVKIKIIIRSCPDTKNVIIIKIPILLELEKSIKCCVNEVFLKKNGKKRIIFKDQFRSDCQHF